MVGPSAYKPVTKGLNRSTSKILLGTLKAAPSSQKNSILDQLATHLAGKIGRELSKGKSVGETSKKIEGYLKNAKLILNNDAVFNRLVKSKIKVGGRTGNNLSATTQILKNLGLLEEPFIPIKREFPREDDGYRPEISDYKPAMAELLEKPKDVYDKPAELASPIVSPPFVAPPLIVYPAPPLAVDTTISCDAFKKLLDTNGINYSVPPSDSQDPPMFLLDSVFPCPDTKLEFRDFVQAMNFSPDTKRVMNDLLADRTFRLFKDPVELPLFINTKLTELENLNSEVVRFAAKSLSILAFNPDSRKVIHTAPLVVEKLQALLTVPNLEVVKNAFEALRELWREKPESIKDSVNFLKIAADSFRAQNIDELAPEDISHMLVIGRGLVGLLEHDDSDVRETALNTLSGFASHPQSRDALYDLIPDVPITLKRGMVKFEINRLTEDIHYFNELDKSVFNQVLTGWIADLPIEDLRGTPHLLIENRKPGYTDSFKRRVKITVGDTVLDYRKVDDAGTPAYKEGEFKQVNSWPMSKTLVKGQRGTPSVAVG